MHPVASLRLFVALVALGGMVPTMPLFAEPLEYNRDIRPILTDKCFSCHGADSASRKADLRLDQRENAVEMGAITAGDLDESEMIARILTDDAELVMPPPETKKVLDSTRGHPCYLAPESNRSVCTLTSRERRTGSCTRSRSLNPFSPNPSGHHRTATLPCRKSGICRRLCPRHRGCNGHLDRPFNAAADMG